MAAYTDTHAGAYLCVCTYLICLYACVLLLLSVRPYVRMCVRPSVREVAYAHVLKVHFGQYICTEVSDDILCHAS